MTDTTYTVANLAGGDLRKFRLVGGQLSDASIRHARSVHKRTGMYPVFGGAAGEQASDLWDALRNDDAEG